MNFSNYRFSVVGMMAIVYKFIIIFVFYKKTYFRTSTCRETKNDILNEEETETGKGYFYKETTLAIKEFNEKSCYDRYTYEWYYILHWSKTNF